MTAKIARIPRLPPLDESPEARIKRLQLEAMSVGAQNLEQAVADTEALARRYAGIAGGGNAYPVGAREFCRLKAEALDRDAASLRAIICRGVRT